MDTIKSKYHETLAATIIKNLEKRQMEGYYCPTVEDKRRTECIFRRLHDFRGNWNVNSSPPRSINPFNRPFYCKNT